MTAPLKSIDGSGDIAAVMHAIGLRRADCGSADPGACPGHAAKECGACRDGWERHPWEPSLQKFWRPMRKTLPKAKAGGDDGGWFFDRLTLDSEADRSDGGGSR